MKTIIISDIKSNSGSIIPYGLELAKHLQSEVKILHIVDPRIQQGVYSAYSDSQSIAPGDKLSYENIIEREKSQARIELDRILSREASRLNFPLKITIEAEEYEVEEKMKMEADGNKSLLIMINQHPDNYMFVNKTEIVQAVDGIDALSLILPPGMEFREFKKVLFLSDFTSTHFILYDRVLALLNFFKSTIDIIESEEDKNDTDTEIRRTEWTMKMNRKYPDLVFTNSLITGSSFFDEVISYIDRKLPDLVVMIKRKQNIFNSVFHKRPLLKLISHIEIPVLYSA